MNDYDELARSSDAAFEMFAGCYPHEAYDAFPDDFWVYFQKRCPNTSRDRMVELLAQTREEGAA